MTRTMKVMRLTLPEAATVSDAWRLAAKSKTRDIQALASEVGVTRQYMSRILNGHAQTIPATTYLAICEQLEIAPDDHILQKASLPWEP